MAVLKFVSLFAGIGGLDLGLERAGHECMLQVENDEFCQRVLAKHWPDVRRISDVHDVTAADCEGADVIVGGFPCQPVSLAGRRQAQADSRWLWPQFARILSEVRPRYVIVENVPGLLSTGMGEVLGDLSALGYDAEWYRVAAETVGAPHLRWRIFIVAYARSEQRAGEGAVANSAGEGRDAAGSTGETVYESGTLERSTGRSGLPRPAGGGAAATHADGDPLGRPPISRQERSHWAVEPDVGRVAHGVPSRVDRLRGLGNAVVPQVAELIGRQLPLQG